MQAICSPCACFCMWRRLRRWRPAKAAIDMAEREPKPQEEREQKADSEEASELCWLAAASGSVSAVQLRRSCRLATAEILVDACMQAASVETLPLCACFRMKP